MNETYTYTPTTVQATLIGRVGVGAVLRIYNYLRVLNRFSTGIGNRAVYHYGHHNDSIHFLFGLLAKGFISLSSIDIKSIVALKEAERYRDFLDALIANHNVLQAMDQITPVTVQNGYRAPTIMRPSVILVHAREEFSMIIDTILHERSKMSILEHIEVLRGTMDFLVQERFCIASYIMAGNPVDQSVLVPTAVSPDIPMDTLKPLQRYLSGLSHELYCSSQETVGTARMLQNGSADAFKMALEDTPFYDAREGGLAAGSGIFNGFSVADVQHYLYFCGDLIKLGRLRPIVGELQDVLRTGGDVLAAVLSGRITYLMNILDSAIHSMDIRQKDLLFSVKARQRKLAMENIKTPEENTWLSNYSALIVERMNKDHTKSVDNMKAFNTAILDVRKILRDWAENPNKKLTEFEVKLRRFDGDLLEQGKQMGIPLPADYKPLPVAPALTAAERGAGGQAVGVVQKPRVAQLGQLPQAMQLIQTRLSVYAKNHGYQFSLSRVREDIKWRDATLGGLFRLTKSRYMGEMHEVRARWITECFQLLFDEKKTTEQLFQDLKVQIQNTRRPPLRQHFGLHTLISGAPTEMSVCISAISSIVERQLEVMRHPVLVVHPEQALPPVQVIAPIPPEPHVPSIGPRADASALAPDVVVIPPLLPFSQDGVRGEVEEEKEDEPSSLHDKGTIVRKIRPWIEACLGVDAGKAAARKEFLVFWNELCLLERLQSFNDYHQSLRQWHVLSQEKMFLNDVKDASGELTDWKNRTVEKLAKKTGSTPDTVLAETMADVQARIKKAPRTVEKKQALLTPKSASQRTPLIWSSSVYEKLKGFGQNKETSGFGVGVCSTEVFLNKVSVFLLQKDVFGRGNAEREAENQSLDAYLKETFEAHLDASVSEPIRAFYLEIAKGLLMLGASPLSWMNDSSRQFSDNGVYKTEASLYFLAAKQVDLIIAHLYYRALRVGEPMLFIGSELEVLLASLTEFAKRLTACVESDNTVLWKLFSNKGWLLKEKPQDGRYQRAALLWAALQYVYVIVNDDLFKGNKDLGPQKTKSLSEAETKLNDAIAWHEAAVQGEGKLYNTGIKVATQLSKNFRKLIENITGALSERRATYAAVMNAQAADQRAEELKKQSEELKKQSEEWKEQSEEALTEANKLRTQIEVQQAQMAAQIEAQQAQMAAQIEAQQAQMAAQIEAQQAQLARDDLARNLHKKLCEKPARKQRVLSGEGMRALFTEVVDTTAMTFRLDKSTLTSVALELIDNEAAFEGCRLAIHALFANVAQRGVRDAGLGVGVLLSHAGLFPGAEDGVPSSDAASASNAPALRRTK